MSLPELRRRERPESFSSILLKTALLLGLIAVIAVGVSWSFGWVAIEQPSRDELFSKILDGRRDLRRAAAIEWSRRLVSAEERGREDEVAEWRPQGDEALKLQSAFGTERIEALEVGEGPYLSGVAQILSFSSETAASARTLCGWLGQVREGQLVDAQVFVVLGLGRLARVEPAALCEPLLAKASDPDPAIRKSVAFVLGLAERNSALGERRAEVLEILRRLHASAEEDVRWNAAFSAALWRDPMGRDLLSLLLDEGLAGGQGGGPVLDAFRLQAIESAIAAALRLEDSDLHGKVERIARESPSLKLRQAAVARLKASSSKPDPKK